MRFKFAVFEPQAVVSVISQNKYKLRCALAAGEIPVLTLKLRPGEDVLEAARTLAEDLALAVKK